MKLISSFFKKLVPSTFKDNLRYDLGFPSQKKSFQNLKALSFTPKTVLDIGAYEGYWAKDFKSIFTNCRILMLEGQTSKEDILKKICNDDPEINYKISLLGATEKTVNFNIYDSASSVLEENNQTGAITETRKLISLDKL